MKSRIEITNAAGEVVHHENFTREESAQDIFDKLEEIRYPHTYANFTMNLSEFGSAGNIGTVRLIAVSDSGKEYLRRELFRNA